jgi:hypothetical protein
MLVHGRNGPKLVTMSATGPRAIVVEKETTAPDALPLRELPAPPPSRATWIAVAIVAVVLGSSLAALAYL